VPEARTVTVTLSPLLRDIIAALVNDHVPLNVVAELDSRSRAALAEIELFAPDLVLIGLRSGETDDVGLALLSQIPTAKVIAISSDGRDAYVHEMRACRTALLSVSPQVLAATIAGPPTRI